MHKVFNQLYGYMPLTIDKAFNLPYVNYRKRKMYIGYGFHRNNGYFIPVDFKIKNTKEKISGYLKLIAHEDLLQPQKVVKSFLFVNDSNFIYNPDDIIKIKPKNQTWKNFLKIYSY